MKDLGIGGIVILNNVSGEKDTIVEPMVVVKVDHRYSRYGPPSPAKQYLEKRKRLIFTDS